MTKIEIIGRAVVTGLGNVLMGCLFPLFFVLFVLGLLAEQYFPAFDRLRSHFLSLLAQYHTKNIEQ